MNLDQLLDGEFSQLSDKPEFKPYPRGQHAVTIHFKEKKFGDKGVDGAGIEVKFKYLEKGEFVDENDVAPEAGAEATLNLNLTHKTEMARDFNQGIFKIILAAIAEKNPGVTSPRQLMELGQGAAAIVTTGLKDNKEKTGKFLTLEAIQIA